MFSNQSNGSTGIAHLLSMHIISRSSNRNQAGKGSQAEGWDIRRVHGGGGSTKVAPAAVSLGGQSSQPPLEQGKGAHTLATLAHLCLNVALWEVSGQKVYTSAFAAGPAHIRGT